jgi:hypothetical protein
MMAQLTHLRPRPGNLQRVITLIEEWGRATRDDASRPAYSFLCRDEDHLFVISLHADPERYEATARANADWVDRLMPLLVENHGPTYYGPVLAQEGRGLSDDMIFPSAMRIGGRP